MFPRGFTGASWWGAPSRVVRIRTLVVAAGLCRVLLASQAAAAPVIGPATAVAAGGTYVSLSCNGNGGLALWDSYQTASSGSGYVNTLFGGLLAANGQAGSSWGFPVATTMAATVRDARAAWNGSSWLVVWPGGETNPRTSLYAARVSGDGTVLDDPPLLLEASTPSAMEVAWGNDAWLVSWAVFPNSYEELRAVRIAGDGTVLDSPALSLDTDKSNDTRPLSVAWGDNQWLVGLGVTFFDPPARFVEQVIRVTGAGAVRDAPPIGAWSEGIIWTGEAWLSRNGPGIWNPYAGKRYPFQFNSVCPNGTVRAGPTFASATYVQPPGGFIGESPGPAPWDGSATLHTWQPGINGPSGDPEPIYGTRFDATGASLDGEGQVLVAAFEEQEHVESGYSTCAVSPGTWALTYSRRGNSQIFNFIRTIQWTAPGGACNTDADCVTNSCRDGKCERIAAPDACGPVAGGKDASVDAAEGGSASPDAAVPPSPPRDAGLRDDARASLPLEAGISTRDADVGVGNPTEGGVIPARDASTGIRPAPASSNAGACGCKLGSFPVRSAGTQALAVALALTTLLRRRRRFETSGRTGPASPTL